MKYFAVRYGESSAFLVEVDDDNNNFNNGIVITEKLYKSMLKDNQEKKAEIRVIIKNGTETIGSFFDMKPSRYHVWDENLATWMISKEDEIKKTVYEATEKKKILTREATVAIDTLQDAIDLGMATDEEEAQLKAWKKYRVLLNRVDTSLAPNIEWPDRPSN